MGVDLLVRHGGRWSLATTAWESEPLPDAVGEPIDGVVGSAAGAVLVDPSARWGAQVVLPAVDEAERESQPEHPAPGSWLRRPVASAIGVIGPSSSWRASTGIPAAGTTVELPVDPSVLPSLAQRWRDANAIGPIEEAIAR